jgi:hypothetical protein
MCDPYCPDLVGYVAEAMRPISVGQCIETLSKRPKICLRLLPQPQPKGKEVAPMPDWSSWNAIPVLIGVIAIALLVLRAISKRPARVGQRIGLWLAALVITYFGPFSAADPHWSPTAWAAAINAEKDFKDLWLAMIAMLVFSLSNIADNLLRTYKDISTFSQGVVPVVIVLYILALIIGMYKYAYFEGKQLEAAQFGAYWTIVWVATAVGLFWEFLIALETKD